MPALPNISHPKLDGRKIVPWGRFTPDYHTLEERIPFFLTDRNEVWEGRLFTQRRGSDAGTKKAELRYLGTMTEETYAKFGITPPTRSAGGSNPVTGPIPDGLREILNPLAAFGGSATSQISTTLAAGTSQGITTSNAVTMPTNTNPNANANNNTGSGSLAGGSSWANTVSSTVSAAVNTAAQFVNSLNIPGLTLPTTPPPNTAPLNNTATNAEAGGPGQPAAGSTSSTSSSAAGSTSSILILAAAAAAAYLLLRKKG